MSAAVAQFDPLQPGAALPDATRAELVPMRNAVDDLGARLAKRVASERAFTAHAAHALRTPLAGMVAQLAVAQRTAPAEVQPQLQRTREAADRLRRVVSALLTLFRTGGELLWQRIDLADMVAHLPFETMSITTQDAAPVEADPDLLAAALMNLLDNSLRHGAKGVDVSTRATPDGVFIVVRDDGTGMTDADRSRLQAALDRQSYDEATGLGLMLGDLVARAHRGRLRIVPSASGCVIEIGLGMPQET
jgi:two-component system OmpR family sensor kinase